MAKALKRIYQATDDAEAEKALDDFEAEWGNKYPSIAPSWRRAWQADRNLQNAPLASSQVESRSSGRCVAARFNPNMRRKYQKMRAV